MAQPDLQFNLETMATGIAGLRASQANAAGIAELAADANPEWYIWGAAGLAAAPMYWSAANDIHEDLQLLGEGLQNGVEKLEQCVDRYESVEQTIADAFARILRALG